MSDEKSATIPASGSVKHEGRVTVTENFFGFGPPTHVSVKEECYLCGVVGSALDGASMVLVPPGVHAFRCRACTTAEMDAIALNELIDRLTRNPSLAAKVRKALEEAKP